jgi:hypothetical protein
MNCRFGSRAFERARQPKYPGNNTSDLSSNQETRLPHQTVRAGVTYIERARYHAALAEYKEVMNDE